jgi:brefeldin A-resistance guanine nucleotide exchange factor 1
MLDLYVNYDCDVACTNLFEELCRSLCRNAVPETGPLTTLHVLSLEGVLAVVENMARRWVEALTNTYDVTLCGCVLLSGFFL